jgi:DNA-binding XRE family transcriptional regulator
MRRFRDSVRHLVGRLARGYGDHATDSQEIRVDASEQPIRLPPLAEGYTGSGFVVTPVFVVSQAFPARPSALPDAHEFVRSTMAAADFGSALKGAITDAINGALLAAASPAIGAFTVVIRLFPDEAEIEVLASADAVLDGGAVPTPLAGSFAKWLAEQLRKEGLSQEAAARQLGLSVRTVSRWVRGQTEPRLRDVRKISDAFGPLPPG